MKAGIALAAVGAALVLVGFVMEVRLPLLPPGATVEATARVHFWAMTSASTLMAIFGVIIGAIGCVKMFQA